MAESKTAKKSGPAVGIDLGSTMSAVAIYRNGKTEVIANKFGSRLTPSWVAFSDAEGETRLVGESAKNQAAMNPKNTIFDIKRLIGRNYNDIVVQQDMKTWPFKVVDDGKNKPLVEVLHKGEVKRFTPEEISAMILSDLKQTAEDYLGQKVTQAVITVPARFGDSQKRSTGDSASVAAFSCLRLLCEPTAAAIAFGMDQKMDGKERNILVLDLGGSTADTSLITMCDGLVEVKATGGDDHFGGLDINARLMEHLAKEFKTKYRKDIKTSARALIRLNAACERAKCTLSSSPTANIQIDSLFEGQDFTTILTKAKMEDLCADLFNRVIGYMDDVLKKGNVSKSDIDEILLVGGMTRTPKIQELVKNYFGGKDACRGVNPDEAVAVGAAICAAQLSGEGSKELKELLVVDVTPLSLGVAERGTNFAPIVPRSSTIPCTKSMTFSTGTDNQTSVEVEIFEGERPFIKDNNRLGKFVMSGIAPQPRGVPQIEIKFDIDANGLLTVTAEDKKSGTKEKLTITNDSGRLSKEQIEKMVMDAERFKAEDNAHKERVDAKNKLESMTYGLKSKLGELKLNSSDAALAERAIGECQAWMESNPHASKEEFETKCKELQATIAPLVSKASGDAPPGGAGRPTHGGPTVDEVD